MPAIRLKTCGAWPLTIVLLLSCALQAATPDEIKRAILKLGHAEWKVREEAQLFLWNAGEGARAFLQKAAASPDPEIRYRAGEVLLKLRYGIKPDTPPEMQAQLLSFHNGDRNVRQQIVRKLSQQGEKAHGTLRTLFNLELDEVERKQLFSPFAKAFAQQAVSALISTGKRNSLPFELGNLIGQPFRVEFVRALASKGEKGFPHLAEIFIGEQWKDQRPSLLKVILKQKHDFVRNLILKDDHSTAAEVLEEAARTGGLEHILDYVAFQILNGHLEKAIRRYRDRHESYSRKIDAQVLFHLLRAKGDFDSAMEAAKAAQDEKLIRKIELDRGDWSALLERYPAPTESQRESIEYLGLRLTFARLTGDPAFSDALNDVMSWKGGGSGEKAFCKVEALLLNERPGEALEVLKKANLKDRAFELLCDLLRFEEAIQFAEEALASGYQGSRDLRIEMAKEYDMLGKKDESRSILSALADEQIAANDTSFMMSLIKKEHELGLKTEALQHCARLLSKAENEDDLPGLFDALFGNKDLEAEVWWQYLRSSEPDKSCSETLFKVQRLLDSTGPNVPLVREIDVARRKASTFEGNRRGKWLRSIAAAYDRVKLADDAAECVRTLLDASSDLKDLLWAGDFFRWRKEWSTAADAYEKAVSLHPTSPAARFLHGKALVELGFKEEGKRQMRLGELLPLGSLSNRSRLIDDLGKHKLKDAKLKQRLLVLQIGADDQWEYCDSLNERAVQREEDEDFLNSALDWQRYCILILGTDFYLYRIQSYLNSAHYVREDKAFEYLKRRRWAEAALEAQQCMKFNPARMWTLAKVVQALDKHDHKDGAKLYREMREIYEPLARAYPESGYYVGCPAWLSAWCSRDLAPAFDQATRANSLFPNQPWILETLAILHRKQRNHNKAISLIERCAKLKPDSDYFRKELKNYRTDLTGSFE